MNSTTTTQRIELRAIERCMSMSDSTSFKIAHVMLVRGSVQELLRHAPKALVLTFNRHPKMRARMLKNEFAVAEIQPHLMLEDIAKLGLLQVKETDADGMTDPQWHAYVQQQVNIPFDRYNEFPFCLHVWVDRANDQARLFLFSDHYLSDGSSGNTVLNDVLTLASSLSLASETAAVAPLELPLRESLYSVTLAARPYLGAMLRMLMKVGAKALLKSAPTFVPVIKPRSDQRDFSIPAPINSSKMLFANGTKENLSKLQARCREEGTTFFGAMTAAIFTGYAHAITASDPGEEKALKMRMYANFNMRQRVSEPLDPETVGSYATATPMEKLGNESVDINAKRFWDLAREAKQETTEMTQSFASLALPMVLLDQHFTSQSSPAFFEGVTVPYASVGDVNVSSVGRYPYATSHAFQTSGRSGSKGVMSVESVHYNCRTPFMATSSQFYFTSVHSVGYSFNHHYDEQIGRKLFENVVAVMEMAGGVVADATLASVIQQVEKPNGPSSSAALIA